MIEQLARQNLHYHLFHLAPKTQALLDASELSFDAFLQWANVQSLSMHWSLPMHFLRWLHLQPHLQGKVGVEISKEILVTTVTRWSLNGLEHISARGILVSSACTKGLAVGLWKSEHAAKSSTITLLNLAPHACPIKDSYALSFDQGNWQGVEWLALPL